MFYDCGRFNTIEMVLVVPREELAIGIFVFGLEHCVWTGVSSMSKSCYLLLKYTTYDGLKNNDILYNILNR